MDAESADFALRLRDVGVAQPYLHSQPSDETSLNTRFRTGPLSPSFARDNATLSVLEARQTIRRRADRESRDAHHYGFSGRQLFHMGILLKALQMRSGGRTNSDVEKTLGLQHGVMEKAANVTSPESNYLVINAKPHLRPSDKIIRV
ncbi:hypothetical protein XA68_18304 [Ophiocordyceps unilateralis]|uniref:Helix-turn-helix domain-containing protein n=1 Tax=Ophiocordyceps unilateralis TaxID=268505 RepID=A0A2A9P3K5_OPHUN|nr:hypothetical protein XA68_18304 [Ophiocordyceps unilateralis]